MVLEEVIPTILGGVSAVGTSRQAGWLEGKPTQHNKHRAVPGGISIVSFLGLNVLYWIRISPFLSSPRMLSPKRGKVPLVLANACSIIARPFSISLLVMVMGGAMRNVPPKLT